MQLGPGSMFMTAVKKVRLDTLLVSRGLAPSRERAQRLILAGLVQVAGRRAEKAGTAVEEDAAVTVTGPDIPYVGRGGLKLAHALDHFGIDPTGRVALDIGASTGGFTDALLQRGARHVVALDVGHGQLDWSLRSDPRVTTLEGVNARTLTEQDLPEGLRHFDLVTIDVSFISLRLVLPSVPALLASGADVVALVKPQFEAERNEVGKRGVIRDERVHERVLQELTQAAQDLGFIVAGVEPSPITGAEGNREFLMHLRRS